MQLCYATLQPYNLYIHFSTHSTVYNIYTMMKIANMHNNHYYSEVKWTHQQWNGLSGKSFARTSNLAMTTALLKGLCWFVQVLHWNNVTSHAPWSHIAPYTPYKHSIQYTIHNYTILRMQNDTQYKNGKRLWSCTMQCVHWCGSRSTVPTREHVSLIILHCI